jgi:type I restriction enzyme, S subunit
MFLWLYLNYLRLTGFFVQISNAAVNQSNFNAARTSGIHVPVPPLAEQGRIVSEVDRRLSFARELEAEVEKNQRRAIAFRRATIAEAFRPDVRHARV